MSASSAKPGTGSASILFRPALAQLQIAGLLHVIALVLVVCRPGEGVLVPALLVLVLAAGFAALVRSRHDAPKLELAAESDSWQLRFNARDSVEVPVVFPFVSRWLVIARVSTPHQDNRAKGSGLYPLAAWLSATEDWRRLHLAVHRQRRASGVADDNILGGKIDGDQNGIPGHR